MAEEQHRIDLLFDDSDEYCPEPPPAPEIPAWKDGSRRIGIHTSIAGNISTALELAHALGANALQIFSASPRMWTRGASRISEADASRFRARRKELQLGPLVIHDNYLINLASANPVLRARSVQAFHHELVRAMSLGADYLVVHPGCCGADRHDRPGHFRHRARAPPGRSRTETRATCRSCSKIWRGRAPPSARNSMNCARSWMRAADLPLGVCVDTAHLFAAGWDIRTEAGLDKSAARISTAPIGLDRVRLVHVNDSKTPLGSRVDRHEHIGKGKIGLEAFRPHPESSAASRAARSLRKLRSTSRATTARTWQLFGS